MATSVHRVSNLSYRVLQQHRIDALMSLQKAAQTISSILDLDQLLDVVVNRIAVDFGCVENGITLVDFERNELVMAAIRGCTVYMKGARIPLGPGIFGKVLGTGKPYYAPDVRQEPDYQACEPATRCELVLPLKVDGRVIGLFDVSHHDVDAFPPQQIELLKALAGHIAVAVSNAQRFQRERQQRERMHAEQQEARQIQQALLPRSAPALPGLAVEAACVPAGAVGGDWYDYIPMPDGRLGIVLADVSGKGLPAAMLMSATRGILRSLAGVLSSPAEILGRVNQMLLSDFPSGRYVTLLLVCIDAARREITFANAGHPWPLLWEGGEARCLCTESGFPLGLLPCVFDEQRVVLPEDFRLLLFTDGITEATNPAGEEFGRERLTQHLSRDAFSPNDLLRTVDEFSNGCGASDDATVVLVRSA